MPHSRSRSSFCSICGGCFALFNCGEASVTDSDSQTNHLADSLPTYSERSEGPPPYSDPNSIAPSLNEPSPQDPSSVEPYNQSPREPVEFIFPTAPTQRVEQLDYTILVADVLNRAYGTLNAHEAAYNRFMRELNAPLPSNTDIGGLIDRIHKRDQESNVRKRGKGMTLQLISAKQYKYEWMRAMQVAGRGDNDRTEVDCTRRPLKEGSREVPVEIIEAEVEKYRRLGKKKPPMLDLSNAFNYLTVDEGRSVSSRDGNKQPDTHTQDEAAKAESSTQRPSASSRYGKGQDMDFANMSPGSLRTLQERVHTLLSYLQDLQDENIFSSGMIEPFTDLQDLYDNAYIASDNIELFYALLGLEAEGPTLGPDVFIQNLVEQFQIERGAVDELKWVFGGDVDFEFVLHEFRRWEQQERRRNGRGEVILVRPRRD